MKHKWLWIIRHGHAANSLDIPDFERPLTQQGQEQALVAGRGIRSITGAPEFVLTSSAPRATATAKLLAGKSHAVVEEQEHLYMASVDTLLAATWSIPSDIRSAIVVGHNPGVSHLANLLAGQTEYRLPPLGAVCFEVTTPWEDLGSSPLRVSRFVEPSANLP
ncbi:MAG: hypothetical protein CMD56_01820 [Gammaproteobacteria bacterium]|jgi:phosphohistidine phosphatase|nr:hypothetical protein [Gammaproteobacteria bacterium]